MHGIAAKVPQKIGVLLKHHDVHTGARQQVAKHHAGGAATNDAALCLNGVHCMGALRSRAIMQP